MAKHDVVPLHATGFFGGNYGDVYGWLIGWLAEGDLMLAFQKQMVRRKPTITFSREINFFKCLRIFHICTVPYSTSLHSSVTKREPLHYQVDPYSDGGEMPAFMDIRRS